jgi:hypothetical protein
MTSITLTKACALSGAILLPGCLLLAACSSGASTAARSGSAAHGPVAAAGRPATFGSAGGTTSHAGAAVQTAHLMPASQSIIYTASLTLRSGNVMASAQRAIGIVTAAGGYVADEHAVTGSPGKADGTVSLTLKIPVPSYQAVLGALSAPSLGQQVSQKQQATDVTQEVANVASLVTSQQDAINALQGLLNRAATIGQLLQVQQQISSDESSLNSLLAQQRALDHETSYATVNMTLLSPLQRHVVKHKAAPPRRGFFAGLAAGWRALRHATGWLLTVLGAVLPFLLVLALLGWAGYAGRRRVLSRRAGPTATP